MIEGHNRHIATNTNPVMNMNKASNPSRIANNSFTVTLSPEVLFVIRTLRTRASLELLARYQGKSRLHRRSSSHNRGSGPSGPAFESPHLEG